MPSRPDIFRHQTAHISHRAMFHPAQISIALERQLISLATDNPMEHKMTCGDFRQHGISHLDVCPRRQLHFVTKVFEEGAHTIALHGDDHTLTSCNVPTDQRQQHLIGQFLALDGVRCRIGISLSLSFSPRRQQPAGCTVYEFATFQCFGVFGVSTSLGEIQRLLLFWPGSLASFCEEQSTFTAS